MEVEVATHHVVSLLGQQGVVASQGHEVVAQVLPDSGLCGVKLVGSVEQLEV